MKKKTIKQVLNQLKKSVKWNLRFWKKQLKRNRKLKLEYNTGFDEGAISENKDFLDEIKELQ